MAKALQKSPTTAFRLRVSSARRCDNSEAPPPSAAGGRPARAQPQRRAKSRFTAQSGRARRRSERQLLVLVAAACLFAGVLIAVLVMKVLAH